MALDTLECQPTKLPAIEALWNTDSRLMPNLFAMPDDERYVSFIPHLDPSGTVRGPGSRGLISPFSRRFGSSPSVGICGVASLRNRRPKIAPLFHAQRK